MAIELVKEHMQNVPLGIIAIDGELGAGKSCFSKELGEKYGIRVIHIDDYLNPGKQKYVLALRLDELSASIQNGEYPVIIEGVCVLTILSGIGMVPSLHFFLHRAGKTKYKQGSLLVSEVNKYITETDAPRKATKAIIMNNSPTNQLDVDIAYLKSKTIVSVSLSIGGIITLLVGVFLLSSGISHQDSAIFEILGAKLTAKGIGAVILGSSVFWAYFAYSARPKYSRRKEVSSTTFPDGSQSHYELESATMAAAVESPSNEKNL